MSWLLTFGAVSSILFTLHAIINGILLRRPSPAILVNEAVAILIPCRNEAAHIPELMASVRAQIGLPHLRIIVLDDNSTDQTRALLDAHARVDSRIEILPGIDLPQGWLGKPHACHQLAQAATGADIFVFIDADVRLQPEAIVRAVATLRDLKLALISPYPKQVAKTWSERLTQPLLQWSWLATLPLRWAEKSARPSLSAANGQFLVLDAASYFAAGGHSAIRNEVLDDIRLLQALKKNGDRGVVVDGSTLATCRMYDDWAQVRSGYTKWLWSAFGSPSSSLVVALLLILIFLLPAVAAITGSWFGIIGYLSAVVGRMVAAVRAGDRLWYSFFHPVAIALLVYLIAASWIGHRRGTLTWKERSVV